MVPLYKIFNISMKNKYFLHGAALVTIINLYSMEQPRSLQQYTRGVPQQPTAPSLQIPSSLSEHSLLQLQQQLLQQQLLNLSTIQQQQQIQPSV